MFSRKLMHTVLVLFSLLLLVACGAAQPEQNSQQTEAQSELAVSTTKPAPLEEHNHEAEPSEEAAMDLEPVTLAEGEKLQVVTTSNIIGDMVENVAGDLVALTILMPLGSDPHAFQPTPQDVVMVANADVVFANGLNFEEFLDELIANAGGEAVVIRVANGVETRTFGEGNEDHEDHNEDEHGEDADEHHEEGEDHNEHDEEGDVPGEDEHHHHDGADPHAWMTPYNALVYVYNIETALSALDPAHAETYHANAETYKTQLVELDQWVFEQIETIPSKNREMVTDHDAFGYYADRYGLKVVGAVIPSYSTAAEPSAQEMAKLQEAIAEFDTPAIFVGTSVNPTLAEQVASDTGTQLVPLYTGSLGPTGSGAETYLDYIRYNTTSIVEALK
ncbi:MAG: zinc ABC transporter substrate-binding protein [Anaerolineae bacterium]|nr:zinc ABC transporter substrate-binding protein [Anaerolineae bacterium]